MSTTVSYKGNTIATLTNETKTLTTAGTWVEGDIEIVDVTEIPTYTVTLTSSGNDGLGFVSYNATKYYTSGDIITVNENETITITLSYGDTNRISINGEVIQSATNGGTLTYNYNVTCDIEVSFSLSMGPSYVYITELSDITALTITENGTYTASGSVRGYSPVTVNVSPTLQSKSATPSETAQTITPDSGYDGLNSVAVGAISSTYIGSEIDRRSSTDLTTSGATVTVPTGYYESQASKSVASGSATTPTTTITANPSISVNSSGLITATASASQGVTPTVSEGYVSTGTEGTVTVSGSNTQQLTTQAAKTVTPTTSSQTAVAAGVYTTGAVTVGAIPSNYITTSDANATASDIVSGQTAYVNGNKVTGSLVIQSYYTGSTAPSSSLGADGDIYLQS